jgi:surface antigen
VAGVAACAGAAFADAGGCESGEPAGELGGGATSGKVGAALGSVVMGRPLLAAKGAVAQVPTQWSGGGAA